MDAVQRENSIAGHAPRGQEASHGRRSKTRSVGARRGGGRCRTVSSGVWGRGLPPPSYSQIKSGCLGAGRGPVVPPRPPFARTATDRTRYEPVARPSAAPQPPAVTTPPQEALNTVVRFPMSEKKQLLFFGPPGQVLPNLWVGSMEHATASSAKLLGYTSIISVMRYSVFGGPPQYTPDVNFHNYPFCDNGTDNIPFADVARKIHEALEDGARVLVHCKQGISRSVSSIIAYLMLYRGMNYEDGLALVKVSRPAAAPKFSSQLRALWVSAQNKRGGYRAAVDEGLLVSS